VSARATPSKWVDETDLVLASLEDELRAFGRLSFATCELLRHDERLFGLESCLRFLRFTVFAPDPDNPPLVRRHRIHACRLMLIALGAHTDNPRWTAFQLEQLVEAAFAVAGAEVSDLVQAQFALLAETPGPTTYAQTKFIRALADEIAAKRRRGLPADDLVWIAVRLSDPVWPVTEAQTLLARSVGCKT
jgi:hypothetical protein